MALVFQDSFSTWGNDATSRTNMVNSSNMWLALGGAAGCTTTYPRAGTHCLVFPYGYSGTALASLGKIRTVSDSYFGAEFAARISNLPTVGTSIPLVRFYNNIGQFTEVYITATGAIGCTGMTSASQLTPAGSFTINTYNHVGIKILPQSTYNSTDGQLLLRLNNKPLITVTGTILNANSGYANYETIYFSNSNTCTSYLADLVIWDSTGSYCNDWIGNKSCYVYYPSADTATADFSITGATYGYDAINDTTPDGDTSYIAATAANQTSIFELENVLSTLSGVKAVTVQSAIRQDSAGTSEFQVSLVGTSTTDGTSRVAPFPGVSSSTFTVYQDHFYVDPDGAGAFTPTILNGLKLKVKRTV